MTNPFVSLSRPAKVLLALGALLALVVATGALGTAGATRVDKDEAVVIAQQEIDFEPTQTTVRLVRQGFESRPVWAVSFSIPLADGGFERLTTVVVDGATGDVLEVNPGG